MSYFWSWLILKEANMRDQDWKDRMRRLASFGCIDTPSHILFVPLKNIQNGFPSFFPQNQCPFYEGIPPYEPFLWCLWHNWPPVPAADCGDLQVKSSTTGRRSHAVGSPRKPSCASDDSKPCWRLRHCAKAEGIPSHFFVGSTRWAPTNILNGVKKTLVNGWK